MNNTKDFFAKLLCEEFMDELAERVANKLAKRYKHQNVIFKTKTPTNPYDTCGSSTTVYDSCGSSTIGYGGCGSNSNYRSSC
jgi:hypothetical protein